MNSQESGLTKVWLCTDPKASPKHLVIHFRQALNNNFMSVLISSWPHKKVILCIQVYKVKYNFDRLSIIKKLRYEDNVDDISAYHGEWVAPPSKDARNMMRPLFPW